MTSIKAKTNNGQPAAAAELSGFVLTSAERNLEQKNEGRALRGTLSRLVNVCNKLNLVLA
jgi:hypothetical protein